MKFSEITIKIKENEDGLITGHIYLQHKDKKHGDYIAILRVPERLRGRALERGYDPNEDYPDIEYSLALSEAALNMNSFMINDFRDDLGKTK